MKQKRQENLHTKNKRHVFDKSFLTLKHKEVAMELIWVKKFYQDDPGASAVEYSLLIAFIAIAIAIAVTAFGISVNGLFVKGDGIFK